MSFHFVRRGASVRVDGGGLCPAESVAGGSGNPPRVPRFNFRGFIFCGLAWLGCASTQLGAPPEDLARAHDQAGQGATVFANECASCHGQRGEGLANAGAILGAGALPEYPRSEGVGDPTVTDPQLIQIQAQSRPAGAAWRDPFRNAQDLYTFTTTHLPKSHATALKDDDYWAVVSFVLAAQGASLPQGGIGPANAGSIPIPKR